MTRKLVKLTRVGELDDRPDEWLVEGLMPMHAVGALVGASGTFKSFVALDLACCIATGMPWHGRKTRQGSVIYLSGEGNRSMKKRFNAWSIENGVDVDASPIFLSDSLLALTDGAFFGDLIEEIDSIEEDHFYQGCFPRLIIVDTLARAMAGRNENLAQDVGELIAAIERLKARYECSVLIVHHTGHGETKRARGSSSFFAALDFEVLANRHDKIVRLTFTKAKDWEATEPLDLLAREVLVCERTGQTSLALERASGHRGFLPDLELAVALRTKGVAYREIERATGVSKSSLHRKLRSVGTAGSEPQT